MNKRGNLQGIKLQYQRKAPFFAFPSFYPDQSCAALYFSFLLENRASTHFSPGRFSRNGVPLSIQILHTHTHTHTHIHTPHTLCWLAKMASFHARFWEKVKMHTHTHTNTHTHTHTHTHIHTPHTLCWLAKMASFHARFWEKVKICLFTIPPGPETPHLLDPWTSLRISVKL